MFASRRLTWTIFLIYLLIYCNDSNFIWGDAELFGRELPPLKPSKQNPARGVNGDGVNEGGGGGGEGGE